MKNLIAQTQLFGKIEPPPGVKNFGGGSLAGASIFLSNMVKILIVGAGIYTTFNFIFAGYAFLSGGDDPKKIQAAWAKIYQSIIGLAVAAGSLVLAAIVGKLLFNDYNALLQLRIFGVTPSGGPI